MLSEIKGDPTESYPSDIMDLTGNEFLFRVEKKEYSIFGYDESHIVRRVCTDASVIEEFKGKLDEETPPKNKFSPAFTKLEGCETSACVLDLSPQCNSVVTNTDVSQNSITPSTDHAEEAVAELKRQGDAVVDVPAERKKRTKVKSIKLERF